MKFFWIGKAFCVQKARKKYSLIVDCFCKSDTLLLAGVASKNASIEVQDKPDKPYGAGFHF